MRKMMLLLLCEITSACATADPVQSESASESNVSQEFTWMVGSWRCGVTYHDVAPYTAHQMDATYVFSQPDEAGLIHAVYSESASHADDSPLTAHETWLVGSTPIFGGVPITVDGTDSDGATIHFPGFGAAGGIDSSTGLGTFVQGDVSKGLTFFARTHVSGADTSWTAQWSLKAAVGFSAYRDITCFGAGLTQ